MKDLKLRYQWTGVVGLACAALVVGCSGDDTAQNTESASGTGTLTQGTESASNSATETGTTGTTDGTMSGGTMGSTTGCAAGENACGGCDPLDGVPGEPCGGCELTVWECDGVDAVACVGEDPNAKDYWPDDDNDGYGDENAQPSKFCVDPGAGWTQNNDDCNDDVGTANPDGEEVCNGIDDDCNGQTDEPPPDTLCTDVCCSIEQYCDGQACVDKCAGGELCGENLDLCCEGEQVCYANSCIVPGAACEFTEECALNEICASSLGQCVPKDILPECEFIPEFGDFAPVQGCRWTSAGLPQSGRKDVVATPIVINLSDDNMDGVTDDLDTPDIAFLTYDYSGDGCCNVNATIRIVSGECNEDKTMTTLASISSPTLTNDAGIAAGDLDGDGVPEIVAIGKFGGQPQGTVAFRRTSDDASTWEVLWTNDTYPKWNVHTRGGPVISLADLDGDGTPEVVIGNVVLDGVTGELVWDGVVTSGGSGGIGNNGFLGPSSTVADLDLDGKQEVIAGNTVYNYDGTVKFQYDYVGNNSPCGGSLPCDGFNAVGNFDDDDFGEVVIIRLGEVFIIDDDGTQLHRIKLPKIDCANNESGPPTIADFDGDMKPEIGTASADYYVVADPECTGNPLPAGCDSQGILWKKPNEDCTSRVTASSVFDFEGDGSAEVVYADEVHFRVFDGKTGDILFSDNSFRSHTRIEMPVIADVDRDGSAEIVVGENGWNGGKPGLEVWHDAADLWVRTRRIWNQHGYYITNISKDGDIPAMPEINWLNDRFNNFRQNVQPGGLFEAP
ncbi:MAG: putative metal-binding motif-containing protein, partial [Myxococcales bacterium]|nr:putative metal-binding motif-containing protein [Myxococcales bacterium]